jgi:integrase
MRYQSGSIEEVKTAEGICWYIRFTVDGKRPRYRIGLKSQYPTEAKASRAAQYLRDKVNNPATQITARTFGDVITRYENEEMPERYSTRRGYMKWHKLYISPKWGHVPIEDVDPMEVRAWIKALPKSSRTRGHILAQMRVLFRFAMFWKWTSTAVNPMSLFSIPGSTKRTRKPRTILPKQFMQILAKQEDAGIRAMLVGAYCLGLRVSELFALKWSDFDWIGGYLQIQRAIVDSRVDDVKTESSEALLPLPQWAADYFMAHYQSAVFKDQDDWVFASKFHAGKLPLNSKWVQQNILREAGKGIGLDFNLGWHTFRHSFKNLLKAAGLDPEMMRDMMRHSDTHTTMNVYGETDLARMREASDKAMKMILEEGQV